MYSQGCGGSSPFFGTNFISFVSLGTVDGPWPFTLVYGHFETKAVAFHPAMNSVGIGKPDLAVARVHLNGQYLEVTWQKFDHKKASR